MFEVILSVVSTGRVERRVFETRDEADRYADEQLTRASDRRRRDGRSCGTARQIRVEVQPWQPPVVRPMPQPATTKPAVAVA
jgi:hypothetical protein